jgi:hypothetical protein
MTLMPETHIPLEAMPEELHQLLRARVDPLGYLGEWRFG